MIDPNAVSTIRVGELSPEPFSLTDNVPHEVGTELKRGTIEDLATFISAFIGSTDGVGFRAISVTDGQTLPTTTQQEFILVGKGTYYNVVGGSTIICTEELNAIVSNGSYWFIGVEIPINVELAGITQFIRDGFISTTPSEDAVYDALALKANVADSEDVTNKVSTISTYSTTLYPNEKATHDALDLKLNISDLPTNLTLYPTNVTSDVSGYVKMVTDIHAPDYNVTAVDVSTPAITGTGQLVSQRIADAGVLIGQPGVFNFTTFGNIRRLSGSGTAEFYTQAYHRDSLGVETLVGTSSPSAVVVNGTYAEFTTSGVWDDGEFAPTDRIVIKSYANRIAGGSDPIYQFQFGGTTPVRTLLPVPFSVVDAGYELKSNKQNSLDIDGTGTKYPTVDAVNTLKWVKSNESLSLAQRKGDVLYGILDQYTGEEMTLSKVTGTPTVDGIIYFQLGTEYFKRVFDAVNVRWFGAKGDGINDDTVEIQDAIDAAVATSKKMIVGKGTYMINASHGIDEPFNTRAGRGLFVEGSISVKCSPETTFKLFPSNFIDPSILLIRNTSNVEWDGGTFDGNASEHIGATGEGGQGIGISVCENVVVKNTVCKDFWGDGFGAYSYPAFGGKQYNENIVLDNIKCLNNGRQGLTVGGIKNLKVLNSEFSGQYRTLPMFGIDLESDGSQPLSENITIQGCIFSNNTGGGITFGNGNGTKFISIENNTFDNNGTDISIGGNVIYATDISILNNLFLSDQNITMFKSSKIMISKNKFTTIGISSMQIQIFNDCTDIEINDNFFNGGFRAINSIDNSSHKMIISNNYFSGHHRAVSLFSSKIIFSKNLIENADSDALQFQLLNSVIEGNTFNNTSTDFITGSLTNCLISDNHFTDWGMADPGYPAILATLENCSIDGNYFNTEKLAIEEISVATIPSTILDNYFKVSVNYNPLYKCNSNTIIGHNVLPRYATPPNGDYPWLVGQKVYNIAVYDGSNEGWVCLTSGYSGVWKEFGYINVLDSPSFTGTPTAPTATAGTNTTQLATTAFAQGIRPYKVYTALLTQTGTNAPTATVLENTLGGTVVWTRTSAGSYVGTLAGAFVTDKTVILYNASSSSFSSFVKLNTVNNTIDWQNGADDRMLNNGTMIEIRVYN